MVKLNIYHLLSTVLVVKRSRCREREKNKKEEEGVS